MFGSKTHKNSVFEFGAFILIELVHVYILKSRSEVRSHLLTVQFIEESARVTSSSEYTLHRNESEWAGKRTRTNRIHPPRLLVIRQTIRRMRTQERILSRDNMSSEDQCESTEFVTLHNIELKNRPHINHEVE